MGNCCSSSGGSADARRQAAWRSTGIISLRDAKLRSLPAAALAPDVAGAARVLDASNNAMTELPDEEVAAFGASLQRLVLSANRLASLGSGLGALSGLRHLALDGNRLSRLPEQVGQLSSLEVLLLQGNALTELPATLGNLAKLRQLNVASNQLAALPATLGGCAALAELDACNNALAVLPGGLGRCAKLRVLQLDGNRLSGLPPGLLEGCRELHTLSLHGNPVTAEALAATPGWPELEARRRGKYDRLIAGGAMMGRAGLDEGVDRPLMAAA